DLLVMAPVPARQNVAGHGRVGMADVWNIVDVVNRSGDEETAHTAAVSSPRRKPGSRGVDLKAAGSRVSTRLATRPAGCVEGRLTPCRDDGLLEDYSKLLTLISALERRSFT